MGSSLWHTLTETKCGETVIDPYKFDMKAPGRLRMSIQRPGHRQRGRGRKQTVNKIIYTSPELIHLALPPLRPSAQSTVLR